MFSSLSIVSVLILVKTQQTCHFHPPVSYFIELMKSICVRKYVFPQVVLQVTTSGRQILASSFLISMKKSRKVRIKEHFIQEFLCNLGDKMTQSCNGTLTYFTVF